MARNATYNISDSAERKSSIQKVYGSGIHHDIDEKVLKQLQNVRATSTKVRVDVGGWFR
jgi:hypothetical protein